MARRRSRGGGRRTNLGLLTLLVVAALTGVLAFAVGTAGAARPVVVAHGAAGLALLLLVRPKGRTVRRVLDPARLARRPRRRAVGVTLGGLVTLCVASGVAHAVGLAGPYGPGPGLTTMQVHVGSAVAAGVPLVAHLVARPVRPRRGDLTRRTLLRGGLVTGGGLVAWSGLQALSTVAGWPGADRRATGSHERGSGDPAAMPVTQWFTDRVQQLGPGHRVRLVAGPRHLDVRADDLPGTTTSTALLDCTGGWFATQEWRGTTLHDVLATLGAGEGPHEEVAGRRWRSVDVVSVTGYRRRLPLRDTGSLLLATHAAGRPLSAGHGGPVRLVAPGRRGFWWVKWVERLELVEDEWWVQPPFPLQ